MSYLTRGGLPIKGQTRNPRAVGDVDSVFGRTGDVKAAEGDYSIDQLSDVDTASVPPDTKNLLGWDGSNWTPESVLDSGTFV